MSSSSSVSASGHGRSTATGPRIAVAMVSAIVGIAIVVFGSSVLLTTPSGADPSVFRHVPVPPSLRAFAGLPAPQGGPPGAHSWLVTPGNVGSDAPRDRGRRSADPRHVHRARGGIRTVGAAGPDRPARARAIGSTISATAAGARSGPRPPGYGRVDRAAVRGGHAAGRRDRGAFDRRSIGVARMAGSNIAELIFTLDRTWAAA